MKRIVALLGLFAVGVLSGCCCSRSPSYGSSYAPAATYAPAPVYQPNCAPNPCCPQ